MTSFPTDAKFKYTWRNYQKNFLDQFNNYYSDNHLHIVAPPGSGKTVLGLEIMLKINQPTLIIAPTLAIKNQWIKRFTELFLESVVVPEWISTDIKNPKFLTVTTYQGIHSACNNLREVELDEETEFDDKNEVSTDSKFYEILKKLQSQKIGTFVLDEAHHLKNAWWKTLIKLKDEINPAIVALTATPPFDVSASEWQKYIQLNGPVDAEISVPELMLEGDLCPHQDLVYFTLPSEQEKLKIDQIYQKSNKFLEEIKKDDIIFQAIANHPVYLDPKSHLNWIYDNISLYSSGLIYMNFRGKEIEDTHLQIIGDEEKYIPSFDFFWLEELLEFFLFGDENYFKNYEEHRLNIENRLKRNGFLERRFVSFFNNKHLNQILNSSIGKLQGIKEIADFEYSKLGEDLRMTILTDYIRKEFISNTTQNTLELDKIGAIPIFEKLRRENVQGKKIGILTGSIVIIPKSAQIFLESLLKLKSVEGVLFSELSYDENYLLINQSESIKHDIVQIVTEIFQKGEIQILIGTKSLLGEGWDAPKMNTLVLASFVSSFVLSNQMRGRAIRTDRENPDKTGNIWHLVCFDEHSENGGEDFEILRKRFKTFVGISNDENPCIENNFERLKLNAIQKNSDIHILNSQTLAFAQNRNQLKKRWQNALDEGNILVEEIQIPFDGENYGEVKLKYLQKTIGNLGGTLVSTGLVFGSDLIGGILKGFSKFHSMQSLGTYVLVVGSFLMFYYGGSTYRTLKQYLKYKNISKNLLKIGRTVMLCLMNEKIIKTSPSELKLVGNQDSNGNTSCHLEGGSNYEKSIFIQTLQEVISPIDSPRYLIIQNEFYKFPKNKSYFAVPEIFGRNKKSAVYFENQWNENVGNSSLLFTRTVDGRNLLLKLRLQSMLKKSKHIEHINKWIK